MYSNVDSRNESRSWSVKFFLIRRLLDLGPVDGDAAAAVEGFIAGGEADFALFSFSAVALTAWVISRYASCGFGYFVISFASFVAVWSLPNGAECQSHGST